MVTSFQNCTLLGQQPGIRLPNSLRERSGRFYATTKCCRRYVVSRGTPICSAKKTSAEGSHGSQKGPFNWLSWLNSVGRPSNTKEPQERSPEPKISGPAAEVAELSSSNGAKPSREHAANSFPPAAKWSPNSETQQHKSAPKAEEKNSSAPEVWDEGVAEHEWDGSKQETEAKPDPLGYLIMALMLIGTVFITTSLFKFSGRWVASRRSPPEPQTVTTSSREAEWSPAQSQPGQPDPQPSSAHALYTRQELKELREQGDVQQKEHADAVSEHQQKETGHHAEVERGGQSERGMVFVPSLGWVSAEQTSLLDNEVHEEGNQPGPTEREGQEHHDEQPAGNHGREAQSVVWEDSGGDSGSPNAEHKSAAAPASSQEGVMGMIQGSSAAAGDNVDSKNEASATVGIEDEDRGHSEPEASPNLQALQEGRFEIRGSQSSPANADTSRHMVTTAEAASDGTTSDPQRQGNRGTQEAAQAGGVGEAGTEDVQRQEESWGQEQRRPADVELPKVEPISPSSNAVDLSKTHLPPDASLGSLRVRASVALRASLAATEASQRAAAYSSAATSAASRAAASAERAAAASSVAQQAVSRKSEAVMQEAVSRAERAQAEAGQAVKQAAEAAAYASAHQEVSGSQAAVSEQAAEAPTEEDPSRLEDPRADSIERSRQKARSAWEATRAHASTAGQKASSAWHDAQRAANSAGHKAADAWYASKDWAASAGHQLMAWLSAAVIWLQMLWAQVVAFSVQAWGWVRAPFLRRVA